MMSGLNLVDEYEVKCGIQRSSALLFDQFFMFTMFTMFTIEKQAPPTIDSSYDSTSKRWLNVDRQKR